MSAAEPPDGTPRVLLVGSLGGHDSVLDAALSEWPEAELIRAPGVGHLPHLAAGEAWDAVLFGYGPATADALADLRVTVADLGSSPLIVIGEALDPQTVAAAMRAGASDYAASGDTVQLRAALARCLDSGIETPRVFYRSEAIAAFESAEARFRGGFAGAPLGMAVISPDGVFLRVNQALCEMVGYRAEDLIGTKAINLSHPDDIGLDREQIQQLLTGVADSYQVEKRYYHRRGPTIWVNVSVSLARNPDGTANQFLAQVVDITAAKEAQQRLLDANARLEAILEHVPAWISLRGLDGRYIDVNQQLADIYGVPKDDLLGRYPTDFARIDATMDVVADDMMVWESKAPVTRDVELRDATGEQHTYHTVRYPVFDDAGEISAIGSFAIDITERKRADGIRDRALAEFEEAQTIARVGSWRWSAVTDASEWSRELKRMFGRNQDGPAPTTGSEFFAYVVREDRRALIQGCRYLLSGGATFEADFRVLTDDGRLLWLHVVAHADREHPGTLAGTMQDTTGARAVQRDVEIAQERFRRAFEDAPVAMSITDLEGHYLQVNDALCTMAGYSREQMLSTTVQALTHPEDMDERNQLLRDLLAGTTTGYHRECRMLCANGDAIWIDRYVTLIDGADGEPKQILGHIVDITERRRLEKELRHMADHDPLTGLLNRRGLDTELERHVAHVNRYGARGALLVLDLDHFKTVNDTLGHEAGDRLIVSVAHLLRSRLRQSDAIARLGGDEFAILLTDATDEEATHVAREIVHDVQEHAVVVSGRISRHITASVGVTTFAKGLVNGEEALVNADLAMYDAKEAGRDRVAIHSTERHDEPRMKMRLGWMERIRDALDNGQFALHYQPIMELHSGAVHQYELLLRMVDDNGDTIPPGAFLYIADRYDLIQELDTWVFREAIKLLESEEHERIGSLNVNVSGKSLGDERFLATIESELTSSGVDPGRLIFELTEPAAISNVTLARTFADRLKQLGCRFALDDFGASFGSFFYLKHIPFDYLKIDGEFITSCLTSRTDQLVIESLVSIARGLGKLTIAEGVEDGDTELFLRRSGVDLAQGFHIGRPAPMTDGVPVWDPGARRRA